MEEGRGTRTRGFILWQGLALLSWYDHGTSGVQNTGVWQMIAYMQVTANHPLISLQASYSGREWLAAVYLFRKWPVLSRKKHNSDRAVCIRLGKRGVTAESYLVRARP